MADIDTLASGLGLTDAQLTTLKANITTLKSAKLLALDEDIAQAEEGSRLTTAGMNLIAKAVAGSRINFLEVQIGDSVSSGEIVVPNAAQIPSRTKLINKKLTLSLTGVTWHTPGTVLCNFQLNNAKVTEGFWAREIGLFACEGDDRDTTVLYSYKNFGTLATWVPAYGGATALNVTVSLITVIDQATNIDAVIDASLVYVTQSDLNAHIADTNPHPGILPVVGTAVTTSNNFWATGSDNKLHPITKENMQSQILGDTALALPALDRRVGQSEINIANILTELNSLKDNGVDANLFFAEDFSNDSRFCDFLKTKVLDAAAGGRYITVESLDGILSGHYYTISDGSKSEIKRVAYTTRDEHGNHVFFEDDVKKNYANTLKKTYLYRSTSKAEDGKLGGAGDLKTVKVTVGTTWKGVDASVVETKLTRTTPDLVEGFARSGDWSFTSDGQCTLDLGGE